MEKQKSRQANFLEMTLKLANEVIAKINEIVPWFDVSLFLKEILKIFFISLVISNDFLTFTFLVLFLTLGATDDSEKSAFLRDSKAKITEAMVYEFGISFIIRYVILFFMAILPFPSILLFTCIRVCLYSTFDKPLYVEEKILLENTEEQKLTTLLQRLGTEVPEWLKTPDQERVEWLNKVIKQMWPYLGAYSEDYIKNKVLPGLRFDLQDKGLISGKIPPRVSSVKVREATERLLLDVKVLYDGDFSANFEVKKGVELEMDQIKVDAELTIELKNFVGHSPFVGCIIVHMDKLPKVNVKLKRMGSIIEYSKLAKRACLDYIQRQIKEFFPIHHDFLGDTCEILKEESIRHKEESGSIRHRFSFHSGSTRHSSQNRKELVSQVKSERDSFRVHSEISDTVSDILIDDLPPDDLSIQSESVTEVTNTFGNSEPDDLGLTYRTSISPDDFKELNEQSSMHVVRTESSSVKESTSRTEKGSSQTALGKWEGGLRDAIARDVAQSRQSMQEMEPYDTAETVSVMSEESVEPFTLISREGLTGSLGGEDSHGCIELTTVYKAPSTLLVIVHKVRNLPKKGGRTPNPYVKLHLLSTALKELREESTDILENTFDPEYETTFAFPLTKPLSEYSLKVSAKTKHKRPHYLGRVVLCFAPSSSSKKIKERAWYDLADPKKDYVTCFVGYKDTNRRTSVTRDPPDSFDAVSSSGSESDEV